MKKGCKIITENIWGSILAVGMPNYFKEVIKSGYGQAGNINLRFTHLFDQAIPMSTLTKKISKKNKRITVSKALIAAIIASAVPSLNLVHADRKAVTVA